MGKETQTSPMRELLDELETLAKAQGAPAEASDDDDAAIHQAAGDGDEDDDPEKKDGEDEDKDDAMFGKSMTAVIDGEERDVVDGTALVKALIATQESQGEAMTKALADTVSLLKSQGAMLKAQADEIALLKADMQRIGSQGAGRKSALSVHDKPGVSGAAQEGETIGTGQLMAKAHDAFAAGRINGRELAIADVCVRQNVAIDAGLLGKIIKP